MVYQISMNHVTLCVDGTIGFLLILTFFRGLHCTFCKRVELLMIYNKNSVYNKLRRRRFNSMQ